MTAATTVTETALTHIAATLAAAPSWLPYVNLAAIVLGPLIGIWVTRLIDKAGEARNRRWELFVTLQRTRGLELTPDHVAAINMIPVLFRKDAAVMRAWEELLDSLNDAGWNSAEKEVKDRVIELSNNKRTNLRNKVAEAVGAKLPTKEEHKYGYVPIAWSNEYLQTMEAREQLLKVLKGQQVLQMFAGIYQLPPPDEPPADKVN
jgi:hypothetical protein